MTEKTSEMPPLRTSRQTRNEISDANALKLPLPPTILTPTITSQHGQRPIMCIISTYRPLNYQAKEQKVKSGA